MILFRYFAREVFGTMLVVTLVVLVISMGWRFSGYLQEAANGMLTPDILLLIMAWRLPGFLELILPISFFLAILLAYGRLYVDSEMVVLQACGMSPGRLTMLTLILATIVMVFTAALSLWLKPAGEARVEQLFTSQQNLTEFDTLIPGRFQNLRSGQRVTYTERLTDDGRLQELFMHSIDGRFDYGLQRGSVVRAETGETRIDENGNRFLVLRDGTRFDGKAGENGWRVIEYEEYGQLIVREDNNIDYHRRSAIPTAELLVRGGPQAVSELQWRVSIPFLVPVIALMAIPLSRVNPRQGRFTRLVPGMLCCFLYVISLSAMRAAVEKEQVPAVPGLLTVHAIFIGFVFFQYYSERLPALLGRLRGRR